MIRTFERVLGRVKPSGLQDPRTMRAVRKINVLPFVRCVVGVSLGCLFVRMGPRATLLMALLFGVPTGVVLVLMIEVARRIRLSWFLLNAVVHALLYSLLFTVLITLELVVLPIATSHQIDLSSLWIPRNIPILAIAYVGFLFWMFVVTIFRAFSRKMGKGVLWNWIRGYYHQPRTEERVIMFLDLQGSTTLAEQLGDERFSALIRDFFSDLSSPLTECKGEVSHYIGDEAVLTWKTTGAALPAKVLQFFFLFDEVIANNEPRYRERYGVRPQYKAGVHIGHVVITEVGQVKSEFVLHGDVLNVTSRLQGMCNELGERVLLSTELAQRLNPEPWLELTDKGQVQLKGKSELMAVSAARLT